MVSVGEEHCDECEICAAALAGGTEAAAASEREQRSRRHHGACPRCGHPQRWHRPAVAGHGRVVTAPLPDDLPDNPPQPPEAGDQPVPADTETPAPDPLPPAPAADGGSFVDQIRALTELYQTGMLDDDEFTAAKAIVLRGDWP